MLSGRATMPYPFEEQIPTTWKALSQSSNTVGWRTMAVYNSTHASIEAAYDLFSHNEAIFFKIDYSNNVFDKTKLPVAKGFKVQLLADEFGKGIALIRQSEGDIDLFTKIAVDICNTIIQHQALTENALFPVVVNRIDAWLAFMTRGYKTLSQEAELGLVGELELLDSLILLNMPIDEVLNVWKGPLNGLKDFEIGSGAIEVKSTLGVDGFICKINSLEQLDDSEKSPLFLNGYRFSINSLGKTLPKRIGFLREKLANYPMELSRFNNLLLGMGYLESNEENYFRQFKTENSYFWLVDENFPKLVPGTVPVNIRQAKYEMDLTPLIPQAINLSLVLNKLGIKNCGIN